MPHNTRVKITLGEVFECETVCGLEKSFGAEKQRDLWRALHRKKCETCKNSNIKLEMEFSSVRLNKD